MHRDDCQSLKWLILTLLCLPLLYDRERDKTQLMRIKNRSLTAARSLFMISVRLKIHIKPKLLNRVLVLLLLEKGLRFTFIGISLGLSKFSAVPEHPIEGRSHPQLVMIQPTVN